MMISRICACLNTKIVSQLYVALKREDRIIDDM